MSAAQFSGCTAGAPSQADGDCPEPQEVLAKKPACSLVGKVSLGLQLPPSSPSGSGCLSPEGDGLQLAISVLSFVLCVVLAVSFASKFGKLSSGHKTGKGQFSFQFQRKAMPKNAQTTTQLHSSHVLVK